MPEFQRALADGFARLVRTAPDGWLEQGLRTPIGRAVLDGIFWQMPRHLNHPSASGLTATVRWNITTGSAGAVETYELEFEDGRCRARRGKSSADPRLTITADAAEFVRLATGNSDPVQAYLNRKVTLAGDIMLAARMSALFRIPKARQSSRTVSSSR